MTKQEEGVRRCGLTKEKAADILRTKMKAFRRVWMVSDKKGGEN